MTLPIGFFGKLPLHGDFIRHGDSANFIKVWDQWLQRVIYHSQKTLGQEDWLKTYLTSPLWRFTIYSDTLDSSAYIGFMIPSVDAVGRYFPFTVYINIQTAAQQQLLMGGYHDWFRETEQLILSALENDHYSIEQLQQELLSIVEQLAVTSEAASSHSTAATTVITSTDNTIDSAYTRLCYTSLLHNKQQILWWTDGACNIPAASFTLAELPSASLFIAMLNGQWQQQNINAITLDKPSAAAHSPKTPSQTTGKHAIKAHGETHPGLVRKHNEDLFLCESYRQLWAVADGMGGHARGDIASYRLIEALAATPLSADINTALAMFQQTVESINQQLYQLSSDTIGSTLALLYITGDQALCLWVGDSRIYRTDNQGKLYQLTVDHCLQNACGDDSHILTDAVGAEMEIQLEKNLVDIKPGDRFLICSDGVHGALSDTQLGAILQHELSAKNACQEIIHQVLKTAATDNLTAVVIDP